MRITLLPLVLFALAAGPAFARAQTPGEDDCNNGPTLISGLGAFSFDNSNATTGNEGQNESICYQFGSSAVQNDVWFAWTAPTTGTFVVDTCTSTAIDTKIAAYPTSAAGPCPTTGSVLDCNDDACALQSQISFQGSAGSSYLFQIGTFPGAAGGFGTFNISTSGPSNDDCNTPITITGAGNWPFDCTSATTGNEGQSEVLCYAFGASSVQDDVWFLWTSTFTGLAEVSTCGLTTDDTKIAVYPSTVAGGCPATGSAIACNDDACAFQSSITFAAVGGGLYTIQIGRSPLAGGSATSPGTFEISQNAPSFGQNYGVGYSGDYKGPLHGQPDVNGNTIYESDLVRPGGGTPQLGGASGPEILLSAAQLGLTPTCTNPGPGNPCQVEVDAFSRGRDDPLQPGDEVGHIFFSVDEWAKGVPSTMIDSNGNQFIVEPSVSTEGAGGAQEASADVFTMIPGLLPGPIPPPQTGQPSGNLAVLDGDGRRSSSGHQYPGVGLREPNPPTAGSDNVGSNSDILNLSALDSTGEDSISPTNPVFFSLDGLLFDPLEQIFGTGSAGAHQQSPGDILIATGGSQVSVYATAAQLGIAVDTGLRNDIDALVLWDNGDNVYQPASYPYQWTEDLNGDDVMDADMLLFSVRRGSPIIGSPDSIFGLEIEPGDLLVPPVDSHGSSLLAGPGTPGVFVAAEAMGLRTTRSGAEESDDLNSADVGDEAFYDCNNNGIDDAVDCANHTSDDNNFNGIPDECEDIVEFCSGQAFSSALTCQCPCANCDTESVGLAGCGNGNSTHPFYEGASLRVTGSNSVGPSPSTLILEGSGLIQNQPGLYFQGNNAVNGGQGNHFGDGLRCAGGGVIRLQVRVADGAGLSQTNVDIVVKGNVLAGNTKYYQLWYRDPLTSVCGATFNLTNGVQVLFIP